MEVTRLLADDHRQADRLIRQLQAAQETAEQRRLFRELKQSLEVHARVEEEIFYRALRDALGGDRRIEGSLAEHDALRLSLSQIEQTPPSSSQWAPSLEGLKTWVENHVWEEERELFPKAQSVLPERLREDLGERTRARMAELTGETASRGGRGAETSDEVARQTAEQAQEYARKMREQGEAAIEQGAGIAADQARRVADALHATSENLEKEDQQRLSQYVREAANGLNRFSDRLTGGGIEGLLQEAQATAKRNPAMLVGGAIAAGFLLTRFLKSSETGSPKAQSGTGGKRSPAGSSGPSVSTGPAAQPTPSYSTEAH